MRGGNSSDDPCTRERAALIIAPRPEFSRDLKTRSKSRHIPGLGRVTAVTARR